MKNTIKLLIFLLILAAPLVKANEDSYDSGPSEENWDQAPAPLPAPLDDEGRSWDERDEVGERSDEGVPPESSDYVQPLEEGPFEGSSDGYADGYYEGSYDGSAEGDVENSYREDIVQYEESPVEFHDSDGSEGIQDFGSDMAPPPLVGPPLESTSSDVADVGHYGDY